MQTRRGILWALCVMAGCLVVSCGGSAVQAPPVTTKAPPSESRAKVTDQLPAAAKEEQSPAQQASGAPVPLRASEEQAIAPAARPGLATQFGEDRASTARHTEFTRKSPTTPFVTTTIWYNDAAGAQSLAQGARHSENQQAKVELFNGGLVVMLLDEHQRVLPGFVADTRPYAIGEANARYAIQVQNRTDFTFEILASVDGLDVINGRPAAFDHRGYLISPRDSILIEGFRTSTDTVAAFRFGSVDQSYSVASGRGDRNVGVIGVAFFEETGKTPVYPSEDTRKRQEANPFPGEYSPRPPARPLRQ